MKYPAGITTTRIRNRKNRVKPIANPTFGPLAWGPGVGPSVGDGVEAGGDVGKRVVVGNKVVVWFTTIVVLKGLAVLRLANTVEVVIIDMTKVDILAIRDALRVGPTSIGDVIVSATVDIIGLAITDVALVAFITTTLDALAIVVALV